MTLYRLALTFLIVTLCFTGSALAQTASQGQSQQLPYQPIPVQRFAAPSYTVGGPGGAQMKPPLCEAGWTEGECGTPPAIEAWEPNQVSFAGGGAMTHDGGLLLFTAGDNFIHDAEEFGVYATAVHFDRITVNGSTGLPNMGNAFDRPVRIMRKAGIADWYTNGTFSRGGDFVGVIFDPEVDEPGLVQPYPVDCTTWQISRGGACRRYNLQVIMNISRPTDYLTPVEWNVTRDPSGKPMKPVQANCLKPFYDNGQPGGSFTTWIADGLGHENNTVATCPDTLSTWFFTDPTTLINTVTMVQRRLQIFLDDQGEVVPPGTAATAGDAPDPRWLDDGAVQTLSFGDNGNYFPLTGIEPALTADGRLMFWQSTRNQYTPDDLGQAGGKYWSYERTFGDLGPQLVGRAAAGFGKFYERPAGVCAPMSSGPGQGHPDGCEPNPQCLQATYPDGTVCQNHVPYFSQQNVVYAFRDDPTDPHGWSRPLNLSELYATHGAGAGSEPLVDGVPFSERYPIAAAPILHGDGTPIDWIRGQYFWAHPDGNGLVFNERGHAATSYVGVETKNRIHVIDGPINPASANIMVTTQLGGYQVWDRFNWTDRENFFAFGSSPGMWGPFLGNPALPYTQTPGEERSMVLVGQQTNNLTEFQLRDNPDRILFLHMTKAARFVQGVAVDNPNTARQITHSPHLNNNYGSMTDDATGNGHSGTLIGADKAFFDSDDYNATILQLCLDAQAIGEDCNYSPNKWGDYNNREHDGFNGVRSGASVHLYDDGHVLVGGNTPQLNPAAGQYANGLSGGVFLRVIAKPEADVAERLLLDKPNAFSLKLLGNGRPQVVLRLSDGTNLSAGGRSRLTAYDWPGGPDADDDHHWNHVAFSYGFDGADSVLRLFVDGKQVARKTVAGDVPVASSADDLVLGGGTDGSPDIALDEVELWARRVSGKEVKKMAYIKPADDGLRADASDQYPSLPAGLDAGFLRFPAGSEHDLTAERVALGRALFNEPALSGSGTMSCGTCHEVGTFLAQDELTAPGNGFSFDSSGMALSRQTQPVINRAFGTDQFWDSRSASLEEQSSIPIFSAEEMNSTQAIVDAVLTNSTYLPQFQQAYGTSTPSTPELELALSAYMRNVLAGDSQVDRYLEGTGTLSPDAERGRQLFFGKARCSACHHGPNFTDERLHTTVADTSDDGASLVTGELDHWRSFKTPTLRTGNDTPHFFHNGSAVDLDELILKYNAGAAHGTPPAGAQARDPEIRPLGLSLQQRQELRAYLEALFSNVVEVHP
ncbi:hypothetical protein ABI59_16060 [Acidobacteria bacterium Mor1]|nr:hypothetical protein ABI59_16060 [Acidobacteria bacterium Mor1]